MNPRSADTPDEDLEYLWRWFALHSGQRMQLVSFWLASTALLTAAVAGALQSHARPVALGACLMGAVASVVFALLDARTRQLVMLAERAARRTDTDGPASALAQLIADSHNTRRWLSYRFLIEGVELLGALLFTVGFVLSWQIT